MRLRRLFAGPCLLGIVALALLGCAEDDPLEFTTTVQEATATTTSPTEAMPAADGGEPAARESDSVRPRPEDLIDLRGNERVEIEIGENYFDVENFRVDPGTQIVFVNRGSDAHNVKPANPGAFPSIDKDALLAEPQALILTEPGDYPFYCSLHGIATRGQLGYAVVGDG